MPLNRSTPLVAMLALVTCGISPRDAQAGPLIDWLFGRNQAPAYPVGTPIPVGNGYAAGYGLPGYAAGYGASGYGLPGVGQAATNVYSPPGYAGNYGTYYSSQLPAIGPAGAGYMAPMPSGIAAATLPSTMPPTLSYVPNFQTQAQRTPVTYYRPILTTDPNTGAQVVAMAPCTSYEMLAQRVPALGRSALFGSNSAPTFQPPSQALPTYTLPSGGIPLAYSTPSITAPYSTAYGVYGTNDGSGGYSVLQPQVNPSLNVYPGAAAPTSVGPAGAYPTTPLNQSPYYGSTNGGSSGGSSLSTPWQTVPPGSVPGVVPGLVAPQAPASIAPSTVPYPGSPSSGSTQPGFQQPNYPSSPGVSPPPNVYPPDGAGSGDPADVPPVLPSLGTSAGVSSPSAPSHSSGLRPKLRSVVRFPRDVEQPQQANAPRSETGRGGNGETNQLPSLLPIPAPEGFHREPRWNPGLLREEDMTALRPIEPTAAQWAGYAKPIAWASFESSHPPSARPPASQGQTAEVQTAVAQEPLSNSQLRPILARPEPQSFKQSPSAVDMTNSDIDLQPAVRSRPSNAHAKAIQNVPRDASGWKASR